MEETEGFSETLGIWEMLHRIRLIAPSLEDFVHKSKSRQVHMQSILPTEFDTYLGTQGSVIMSSFVFDLQKPVVAAQKKETVVVKPPSPARSVIVISSDEEEDEEILSGKKNKKQTGKTFTSTLTARSKAACGITKKPNEQIVQIDAADAGNELAVLDYVEDIYKFYKLTEV